MCFKSSITLECDGENDDPRIPFDVHKELYILRLSAFEEIVSDFHEYYLFSSSYN